MNRQLSLASVLSVLGAGLALASACANNTLTQGVAVVLDHPVDVAFACYGGLRLITDPAGTPLPTDSVTLSAQPAASCESWSTNTLVNPIPGPPSQQTLANGQAVTQPNWYGFFLQGTTGTVAVAQWATKPAISFTGGSNLLGTSDITVQDTDPLAPGKNTLVIGEQPVAIATDKAGCFEVTANAGSCDLSTLDINSVFTNDVNTRPILSALGVTIAGQPLRSKPAAMVMEPGDPDVTKVGAACPMTSTGLAYVAYPSCHLVAGVDVATGKVSVAIDFSSGTATVRTGAALASISCPVECAGAAGSAADPAAGKPRPVTLALEPNKDGVTKRLAIGSENDAVVSVVDLDAMSLPGAILRVPLELPRSGKLGISQIALSPVVGLLGARSTDVVPLDSSAALNKDDDGTKADTVAASYAQYVYAVASDGTVRVADVDAGNAKECDTQIDLRVLQGAAPLASDLVAQQCIAAGSQPRRSGARGPGIALPVDAVPLSVAFLTGQRSVVATADPTNAANQLTVYDRRTEAPTRLLGHFAAISASNGAVYIANVADNGNVVPQTAMNLDVKYDPASPQRTAPVLQIAHQLRDFVSSRDATATTTTTTTTVNGNVSTATTATVKSCLVTGSVGDPAFGSAAGGPHVTAVPARNTSGGPIRDTRVFGQQFDTKASELPTLRQIECVSSTTTTVATTTTNPDGSTTTTTSGPTVTGNETLIADELPGTKSNLIGSRFPISEMMAGADPSARAAVFPELRSVTGDETWSLSWEGTLSLDNGVTAIDGPIVRTGTIDSGLPMVLREGTRPFCEMGVEPFDIVDLRGCSPANGNGDCPTGYTCFVHPDSKLPVGSCMLSTEAQPFANACRDFLISKKSYSVVKTDAGALTLVPRKHVLRTTPIDGCVSDQQCTALANYAVTNGTTNHPYQDVATIDQHRWACQLDETRAAINASASQNKRCVQACAFNAGNRDGDCDAGMICVGATPGGGSNGVCMESVVPPQSCVNAPQRFAVRGSDAFVVIGTKSGYLHPIKLAADGNTCTKDPAAGLQLGRIGLNPPACGAGANPCATTVDHTELVAKYATTSGGAISPTCDPDPAYQQPWLQTRTGAPAIKFANRGMVLTVVDPFTPGDATCIGDRLGATGALGAKIPLVFQGYQLVFHATAGYAPMALATPSLASPVKVVHGPTQSLWVLDDGDVLSNTSASTRGAAFRIEPSTLIVNSVY